MITAAALCPAAPLMCAELTGDDPTCAALRSVAAETVAWLVGSGAGVIAVVAVDSVTREWPPTGRADLAPYGGPRLPPVVPRVPFGVGLGGRLLDSAGFTGERLLWTVGPTGGISVPDGAGLLVLADGSAHRDLKTSTDLAARAFQFDSMVERCLADGDLTPLLSADPADLMVTGFPALQVLASLVPAASTSLRYSAAPFGVGYFVATLTPRPLTPRPLTPRT